MGERMTYPKCEICHDSIIHHHRGMRPKAHSRCRLLFKRLDQMVKKAVRAELDRREAEVAGQTAELAASPATPVAERRRSAELTAARCLRCDRTHETRLSEVECLQRFERSAQAVSDWRG